MNPSVILLPDQAASKHTAKVLVKRAKEICLIQNGRLLNRATRLNRFFLPPFPPPPSWLFSWISFSSSRAQETKGCLQEAGLQGNAALSLRPAPRAFHTGCSTGCPSPCQYLCPFLFSHAFCSASATSSGGAETGQGASRNKYEQQNRQRGKAGYGSEH